MIVILIVFLIHSSLVFADGSMIIGGSSTTPGGSSGEVQWNSGGTLDGVSGSGVDSNGNVGIGSTAPGTKLDVGGTVRATGFQGGGTGTVIEGSSGNNVGIGTTTPQAKFVVVGGNVGIGTWTAATARLVTDGLRLTTNPSAGYVLVSGSTGIGTWMSPSSIGAGSVANPTGTIGLSAVNGSATSAIRSDGAPALSQAISPTWTGNHIFNPSSGNTVVTNGNFGVGTAAPTAKLQVVNAGQNFTVTGANVGIGTTIAQGKLVTHQGNIGINTFAPTGLIQVVGLGTTVPQQLCRCATGTFGYFNGAWAGTCTCP